jgi:D-glucosaminate-6-phosphate ammonia-lyase
MNIYERLGIKTVINASDTYTALGGSRMSQKTIDDFKDAARYFVDLEELQQAAGKRIAELTHNEAALVVNGAASGVVLLSAACMAGDDQARILQLPATSGMRNEFIVPAVQADGNPYVHLIELAGGRIVLTRSDLDSLESAINEQTAALFFFPGLRSMNDPMTLDAFIAVGHKHDLPVIVDAAAGLPPITNLWHFTRDMGADAAIFSGGKHLEGPQTTGLVLGRKPLIANCVLNASPYCHIGRPYKVGKEEIIAITSAVEQFVSQDFKKTLKRYNRIVDQIADALREFPDVQMDRRQIGPHGQDYPILMIEAPEGVPPRQMHDDIRNMEPSVDIAVFANYAGEQSRQLFVNPINLADDEVPYVIGNLRQYYRNLNKKANQAQGR